MRREIDYQDAEGLDLHDTVVKINRSAKVMKGGRRFGFSALVVLGDGRGTVGLGFGKAREVPPSVEKAQTDARKHLVRVPLRGTTIPHASEGIYCSTKVRLLPAAPGTGIIAGKAVRKVLERAGITDILTKNYGSTNALNVVKATMMALSKLRSREETAALRGVTLE